MAIFILARVLLKSTDQYTLMVGLQIFTSGQFAQKWGQFSAGCVDWGVADYDYLSVFAGLYCGWVDDGCCERLENGKW